MHHIRMENLAAILVDNSYRRKWI